MELKPAKSVKIKLQWKTREFQVYMWSVMVCFFPSSDAVQSINVVGSRETHVMEDLNLSLHINGT